MQPSFLFTMLLLQAHTHTQYLNNIVTRISMKYVSVLTRRTSKASATTAILCVYCVHCIKRWWCYSDTCCTQSEWICCSFLCVKRTRKTIREPKNNNYNSSITIIINGNSSNTSNSGGGGGGSDGNDENNNSNMKIYNRNLRSY